MINIHGNQTQRIPPNYQLTSNKDDSFQDNDFSDYAEIGPQDAEIYEIERSEVTVGDILGAGQFGDVFRGTYRIKNQEVASVAIKTCKLEREDEMAEKLLEEAGVMDQFDHEHIIRFYGVCSVQPPVWIIMELAELGEVRKFLKDNRESLSMDQLMLYCHQLSTALNYLELKHFVHRDIAARNVLVSSWNSVKLADFGLTRWLQENNYYKASKSVKLPIKWMAPESINYRRFTSASDVWMFAVCMWEILSYGEKPFPGVNNGEVIQLLESGIRLPLPTTDDATCPPHLYALMCSCWNFDPDKRPRFAEVESRIRGLIAHGTKTKEASESKNNVTKINLQYCGSSQGESHKLREEPEEIEIQGLNEIVLERSKDGVYSATIEIVMAITQMSKKVEEINRICIGEDSNCGNANTLTHIYSTMTLNIGMKLKQLLGAVDEELCKLPPEAKNKIVMATNVLNADFASLIREMKLAQQYSNTILDKQYQKAMLQAGHVLAVDSRNLLDAVDYARRKQIVLQQRQQRQQQTSRN